MPVYNLITIIIVLTALFGYLNYKYIKLPGTIGIMLMSLLASLLLIVAGLLFPSYIQSIKLVVSSIDLHNAVMKIMLSFLLFAGAMHVDINLLKRESLAVLTFSTIGVLLSAIIVAILFYFTATAFGLGIEFIYCLLFGALISPTDPIAVLGILRKAKIPASLEIKISGESLFNDGIGVVLFITIFDIITSEINNTSISQIAWLFIKEIVGGVSFGLLLGYLGFYILRSIDNYIVEVLITIAIVMGGYLVAEQIGISGPLSMVVAGIITGNKSMEESMSDITGDYINKFWEMMDEVLNAILFLLVGFQMLVISFNITLFWLGCITILIVLVARYISVLLPVLFLKYKKAFEKNAVLILTWGGLKGGLSVALALSLPDSMHSEVFVSITYIIVLFSIIVQGLTIGKLAKKYYQ